MKTEIEVKFLNVDFEEVRETLRTLGATRVYAMRDMRRSIVETPAMEAKNAFVRVRDEGDTVTLTYKQVDEDSLSGVKEIEVEVSDFEATIALLDQCGLPQKSFQESRRETWHFNGVEVVMDEWPWLNPYIEIEGDSEEDVKKVAEQLGFRWSEAVFGRVTSAYQKQYPKGQANKLVTLPRVAFDSVVPDVISGRE